MTSPEIQLAVLFADISGSTRLYEKLGGAEAQHAVERCIKRMERSVDAHQGRIIKTVGDELMLAFPDADSACQAAIDMQQRVLDLPPVSGVKLAIRIGFHFGPVIEAGKDLSGEAVTTAARMAGLAKASQIVTNNLTLERLSPVLSHSTRTLDRLPVKGASEEMQIVEVIWQEPAGLAVETAAMDDGTVPLPGSVRLCVRHRGKAFLMDASAGTLNMGRGSDADVVIEDRKASRFHARIELRRDKYVLIDMSTNGTFVSIEGEAEVFLHGDEMVLRKKGIIAFGHSIASGSGVEVAEFEYL
ncbi:MAG: adenylate/guanylate cyclase domain-containing protein [Betaproteobacteria bacterium]|nr:adenylate/guanylate cyclase domain-containing protein [Betaproteobacteria bacterium]